jgi:crotonobetainyl-CoA:carnitine CoA-transferase CaiB-like acyl-CoA transferase
MIDAPPLAGVKVVELARILAGPWAGQILADLGAEVIKIESPDGDDTRKWGPPFVEYADGGRDAAYYHSANRGKASICVDFTTTEGQAIIREMAADADILIENFKVGGLAKYGLDFASMAKINPRLIYCSITGFGQTGPYAQRPGYDFIVQGLSGIMDLTGDPAGAPQKIGVAYADIMTGLYSVIAIQAALVEREKSGLGQHIDMALLDVMVGTLANQAMNYLVSGQCPKRLGNAHPNIAPYDVYTTTDSWIIIAVGNDEQFRRLCAVLSLTAPTDFDTNAHRVENREALRKFLEPAIALWSREALLQALEVAGVPVAPVSSVEDAFNDPQVIARELRIDVSGQLGETLPSVALPVKFSRSRLPQTTASPRLAKP